MLKIARKAAELIEKHRHRTIEIISHLDCDGISAAALLSKALDRLTIQHNVRFVRMLYRDVVEELEPADLTIFTDLGSSQLENLGKKFRGHDVIIADHHDPVMSEGWPELVHLNAHHHGLDGMQEISGSGVTYLIARELDHDGRDLSALAVIGAIGDIQNSWGTFRGYNQEILKEAVESGLVTKNKDLMLYGRYSRPVFKSLEFFTDPYIPGVSNSPAGCIGLLKDLCIPLKNSEGWRRLADLDEREKQRLASELIARAYMHVPEELVKFVPGLIIGEVYTLTQEKGWPLLQDAAEFSTCINSTARHEQPLIGLEVAKGDRGGYYRTMLNLLHQHRRSIARGLEFLTLGEIKTGPRGYLQYFDATGVIKDLFVGTVTNLALGNCSCDPYRPLVGVVRENGRAKISARCSRLLFLKGFNMSRAIRAAAEACGGEGGGHAVACGAEIGEEKVPRFLEKFEELLLAQAR
ncbi:MAG: DHHA1 domain-containing protein [Candidatus Hadarchaeum sp.]|uniref:DHHA1 domain-containing protein n=1 Tax=Candidatus Hadarchaeum sp. TaxID=2883567 RepID=UPI003D0D0FCC